MKPELMKKFKELDQEIKEAMRMFGEYTYFDKGPDEVMFVENWEKWLEVLPKDEAIEFANYVVEHDHKDGRFETFIDRLNDSLPEEWWVKPGEVHVPREGVVGSDGSEPIEIKTTSLADLLDEMVEKGKI